MFEKLKRIQERRFSSNEKKKQTQTEGFAEKMRKGKGGEDLEAGIGRPKTTKRTEDLRIQTWRYD